MPSLDVTLIDPGALQSFCTKHETETTALFKVGWALILHSFFESSAFLVRAENVNALNGGICYENQAVLSVVSVVEYRSELSNETTTFDAIKSNLLQPPNDALGPDNILKEGGREAFDSSTQKVWTALDFCSTSLAPAALNENLLRTGNVSPLCHHLCDDQKCTYYSVLRPKLS